MLQVVGKAVFTDGVLFMVRDEKTKKVRHLSEPTLGQYIEKKMVRNASVVHRPHARAFVRLATGVQSSELGKPMPKPLNKEDAKEQEIAKKWFAEINKSDAPANASAKSAPKPKKITFPYTIDVNCTTLFASAFGLAKPLSVKACLLEEIDYNVEYFEERVIDNGCLPDALAEKIQEQGVDWEDAIISVELEDGAMAYEGYNEETGTVAASVIVTVDANKLKAQLK